MRRKTLLPFQTLNHGYELTPDLMNAVNDALALLRTWFFQPVGIVAELVLIDA